MCDWSRCFVLTDPRSWSESDVMKWMEWHGNQFQASYGVSEAFRMTGEQLCRLSSDNFKRRSPEAGANLYAQLDVWKNGTYHFIKSRLKKQIRVKDQTYSLPIFLTKLSNKLITSFWINISIDIISPFSMQSAESSNKAGNAWIFLPRACALRLLHPCCLLPLPKYDQWWKFPV